MLHFKSPGRLAKKLIIAVVLVSSFITIFTTAIQLYLDYRNDVKLINSNISQIRTLYLSSITNAVWKVDKKDAELLLAGLLQLRDMQHFELYDDNGLWIELGENRQKNTIRQSIDLNHYYRGEQRKIGKLVAVASLHGVYTRLVNKLWMLLISNAVKTFLVAAILVLIFRQLITRHLHKLAEHVENIELGSIATPLVLEKEKPEPGKEDEIDIVVRAIQRMQVNLALSYNELKERETRLSIYEKIMSTTSDQMAFIDKNYHYLAVNQAYCDMFNKTFDEIVGHRVADLLGNEYFENIVRQKMEMVFQGKQFFFEAVVSLPDMKLPVEVTYLPYYDDNNEIQGAVINARNISERVRHHNLYRVLARSPAIDFKKFTQDITKLLAELFDAKLTMIGRLDGTGKRIHTDALYIDNLLVENITYELRGTPCEDVVNREQQIITENLIERYPDDHMLEELNAQSYFGAPLINTNGNVVGIVVVLDDKHREQLDWYEDILSVVAARVAIEMERDDALKALHEHRINLEAEVQARTMDLQQVNAELESFAYSVSHDLRTPLRAINGYCAALQEDCGIHFPETAMEYLNRVRSASMRMSGLIDSLLQLSRITRQPLKIEKLDLSAMAQEVIDDITAGANISDYSIEIADELTAHGDSRLISIVLSNLLGNAIKYASRQSQPAIRFEYSNDAGRGQFVVRDNGMGFDMRFKDKLFIPFQRLHDDKQVQGIGIGLATVYRIIMRHQGHVEIESQVDKGTSVYFSL